MSGSIQDLLSVKDLKEWLLGRVADDDDIVIDDLQEEFNQQFDEEDEKNGIKGSKQWQENVEKMAAYEGKPADLGPDWEWDGFRKCQVRAGRDEQGKLMGEGIIAYENKDVWKGVFEDGIMNRTGVLSRAEMNSTKISGTWVNGLLKGEVKETLVNTGWVEGYYQDGVPHGYYREFGPRFQYKHILRSAGRHFRGVLRGWYWRGGYDFSGYLVGQVDSQGRLTGDDIAYIYPDFTLAIRGKFDDGVLVEGFKCELLGCYEECGMMVPVFSEPSGEPFTYEKPSIRNIALHPLQRDPWEETRVRVGQSGLPQGGEGLFAKKDFQRSDVVALYNGIKFKSSTYAADHMPRSDYRIRLNGDFDMDIPTGHHLTSQYCATLAHKANHSFTPNVEWTLYEHPRALTAQVPLKAGEEILVNYQMTLAKSPEWYRVIWLQHMRKTKKGDDSAIQRYIDRMYEAQGYRIPLPESEILDVPEPHGVDVTQVPEEYLKDEYQTDEAALEYAKKLAGISSDKKQPEQEERFEEITDVD